MRGDWLTPHATEAAKPFIKATDKQEKELRLLFSLKFSLRFQTERRDTCQQTAWERRPSP